MLVRFVESLVCSIQILKDAEPGDVEVAQSICT